MTVASNDGQSGDIDLSAQMRADSARVVIEQDYKVAADSTYDVPDV